MRSVFDRVGEAFGGLHDASEDAADECVDLLGRIVQRTEAMHGVRIVEVPGVLSQPDEVPDCRVGRPGATKRRTAQLLRNTFAQKGGDVGGSVD